MVTNAGVDVRKDPGLIEIEEPAGSRNVPRQRHLRSLLDFLDLFDSRLLNEALAETDF
jgi:hypothetical protein